MHTTESSVVMRMGMGILRLIYIRITVSVTKRGHARLDLHGSGHTMLVKLGRHMFVRIGLLLRGRTMTRFYAIRR
jgi:hypothetical protein